VKRAPVEKGPRTWDSPEYIAACDKAVRRVKIQYAESDQVVTARLVHTWRRDDADVKRGPIVSASSGPKDYLVNDILSLFAADAETSSVTMLVLNGTFFLIVRRGAVYFDVSGRQVRVQLLEA
jgi:hypothetical protein